MPVVRGIHSLFISSFSLSDLGTVFLTLVEFIFPELLFSTSGALLEYLTLEHVPMTPVRSVYFNVSKKNEGLGGFCWVVRGHWTSFSVEVFPCWFYSHSAHHLLGAGCVLTPWEAVGTSGRGGGR